MVRGFIQLTTEEEQYARVLNRIGPFVAIGDPREGLPDLGATRIYVGDGDWRQRVEALLDGARLIVLRLSATEGLLWELRTVIARNDPGKLLVLVPGPPENYPLLRQQANEWLPQPLPPSLLRGKSFKRLSTVVALVRPSRLAAGVPADSSELPPRQPVRTTRAASATDPAARVRATRCAVEEATLSIFALVMVSMFVAVLVLFTALACATLVDLDRSGG